MFISTNCVFALLGRMGGVASLESSHFGERLEAFALKTLPPSDQRANVRDSWVAAVGPQQVISGDGLASLGWLC